MLSIARLLVGASGGVREKTALRRGESIYFPIFSLYRLEGMGKCREVD